MCGIHAVVGSECQEIDRANESRLLLAFYQRSHAIWSPVRVFAMWLQTRCFHAVLEASFVKSNRSSHFRADIYRSTTRFDVWPAPLSLARWGPAGPKLDCCCIVLADQTSKCSTMSFPPFCCAQVFEEDLVEHPDNGFALHGLIQSLNAQSPLSRGTADLRLKLQTALEHADVPLTSACPAFAS